MDFRKLFAETVLNDTDVKLIEAHFRNGDVVVYTMGIFEMLKEKYCQF